MRTNRTILLNMKQIKTLVIAAIALMLLAACGGKKQSEDIITKRTEVAKPKAPERMQDYTDDRDVSWIGKTYHVALHREPCDSLPMVTDETGQQFVDNVFSLTVTRTDGSIFFSRHFTKKDVTRYLDDDYRQTGIFEGLVFDRAEGDNLIFAASVGHPQTDEYIPLVITLSRMGDLSITRDTQMDTSAEVRDEEDV